MCHLAKLSIDQFEAELPELPGMHRAHGRYSDHRAALPSTRIDLISNVLVVFPDAGLIFDTELDSVFDAHTAPSPTPMPPGPKPMLAHETGRPVEVSIATTSSRSWTVAHTFP